MENSSSKNMAFVLKATLWYIIIIIFYKVMFKARTSRIKLQYKRSHLPDRDIKYSELKKLECLDVGGSGRVYKVRWNAGRKNEQIAAAKFIKYVATQQFERDFDREVRSLRHSKECKEYIIQFFGLSKDPVTNEYILVMQYANNGNLRDYLRNNKDKLQFFDKISLIKSILKGLEFLHSRKIIHRDLHSKNVLVHNGYPLLADFGLSKSLLETNDGYISEIRGVQAYVDPLLLDKKYNPTYTHTELSDIYSFGVLMWEVYTCRPPFEGIDKTLAVNLCLDAREKPVSGMPLAYKEIYEKCWDKDPEFRPKLTKILDDLENLRPTPTYQEEIDIILTDEEVINEIYGQTFNIKVPEVIIQDEDSACQIISVPTPYLEKSISIDKFLQLFEKVHQNFKITRKSCENVQINRRICQALFRCINLAHFNVNELQSLEDSHVSFATLKNYKLFQELLQNIEDINIFIENISHIRGLKQYVQRTNSVISLKNLKNKFNELLKKFNDCISSLKFQAIKLEIDDIHNEIVETTKFIQAVQHNFKTDMFESIEEIAVRLTKQTLFTEERFKKLVKTVKKIECNNLQTIENVTTYCKRYNSNEKKILYSQSVILKNLEGLANIIKFYGVIEDERSSNSIYLATEWAEYGNLKEYYMKHDSLDILTKLQFALDICNGLVFLKAVNILHCDIRSENIFITSNHRAKISNFDYSRLTSDVLRYLYIGRKNIKYLAPEILKSKNYYVDYDFRCEVYSFGILLWELSNLKTPYEKYDDDDICKLKGVILCDKNHTLSGPIHISMPQEYKDIGIKALDFEPKNRPTICEMFKVLHCLANDDLLKHSQHSYSRFSNKIISQSVCFHL